MGGGLDLVLKTEREKGNLRVHQPSKWRPGAATKSHQPHLNGPLGCSSTGQQRAGTGRERPRQRKLGRLDQSEPSQTTNNQLPLLLSSQFSRKQVEQRRSARHRIDPDRYHYSNLRRDQDKTHQLNRKRCNCVSYNVVQSLQPGPLGRSWIWRRIWTTCEYFSESRRGIRCGWAGQRRKSYALFS